MTLEIRLANDKPLMSLQEIESYYDVIIHSNSATVSGKRKGADLNLLFAEFKPHYSMSSYALQFNYFMISTLGFNMLPVD